DAPQERPPQPYKVLKVAKQSTTLIAENPAKLEGIMGIDIRPKIDGYIEQIYVDEGQEVTKGQLLFKISNPQYAQDLQSLAATVAHDEYRDATDELQVQAIRPLVEKGIITTLALNNVQFALQESNAHLQRPKANYAKALTNVRYTTIKSPVNRVV